MHHPIIEVRGLGKVFRGEIRALTDVSFEVAPGTVHGLLGPNGAGKTTLIRILTTLLAQDAGTALVAGADVVRDPAAVRARIGLAGQYAAVDDYLTGRENVEMVGRLYGLRAEESRRRATDVLERIRMIDAGDRQVKTYSGGMRKRLDLAASLVGRPQVLFLDEPTTGLDPAGRRDVWELVRGLVDDGTTVMLTTQYLDEADQLADRITVLAAGRIVREGTSDELKATVGGAMVELRVSESDRAQALDALTELGAYNQHNGGAPVLLPAAGGVDTLREVLLRLDAVRITPDHLSLRKPTLDDVFLSLTGHTTTSPDREAA
ncbi:MAG TPA: ATP-binding cassette domain-containing protein [Jiangellaceae bacterium]|nr:ATP-binding cassette domain-containing protein [Jiangellaceae bacterium]